MKNPIDYTLKRKCASDKCTGLRPSTHDETIETGKLRERKQSSIETSCSLPTIPRNCSLGQVLRSSPKTTNDRRQTMDVKDSSDEEEIHNISAFTKFDESIEVRNAEEIDSPVTRRPASSRRTRPNPAGGNASKMGLQSPTEKFNFRRYSDNEGSFGKSMGLNSDPSDSEESDDDDIQGTSNAQPVELYNPKDFEDLDVSAEVHPAEDRAELQTRPIYTRLYTGGW